MAESSNQLVPRTTKLYKTAYLNIVEGNDLTFSSDKSRYLYNKPSAKPSNVYSKNDNHFTTSNRSKKKVQKRNKEVSCFSDNHVIANNQSDEHSEAVTNSYKPANNNVSYLELTIQDPESKPNTLNISVAPSYEISSGQSYVDHYKALLRTKRIKYQEAFGSNKTPRKSNQHFGIRSKSLESSASSSTTKNNADVNDSQCLQHLDCKLPQLVKQSKLEDTFKPLANDDPNKPQSRDAREEHEGEDNKVQGNVSEGENFKQVPTDETNEIVTSAANSGDVIDTEHDNTKYSEQSSVYSNIKYDHQLNKTDVLNFAPAKTSSNYKVMHGMAKRKPRKHDKKSHRGKLGEILTDRKFVEVLDDDETLKNTINCFSVSD